MGSRPSIEVRIRESNAGLCRNVDPRAILPCHPEKINDEGSLSYPHPGFKGIPRCARDDKGLTILRSQPEERSDEKSLSEPHFDFKGTTCWPGSCDCQTWR